ncbi:hypothetical protein EMEDMD4_940002 [Sinorhizobium medicae]|uniref:Uncharacterized protein n=1 Tax=Sinorhizobium medicae TaxID=110321 RepID=A0A508XBZ4_9HYPH|nr:hypothetical protein EMEDMD4_940002 [Sinorhizobium medicae]
MLEANRFETCSNACRGTMSAKNYLQMLFFSFFEHGVLSSGGVCYRYVRATR